MYNCFFTGYIHTCKELGEGAPATSKSKYCDCTGREQSRLGQQESCRFPGNKDVLESETLTCTFLMKFLNMGLYDHIYDMTK